MEKYDYYIEVANDIENWLEFNDFDLSQFGDRDEAVDFLNDNLWAEDSITGNGPYGYANESLSEEYLCHNLDLASEAYEEFGYEGIKFDDGAEAIDVTIRCYLLGQLLQEVIDELKDEVEE